MKLLKSFDYFTKAKEEVDTSSSVGGIFSVLGILCGILFMILELTSFLKFSEVREFTVKKNVFTRTERVNIDISFTKVPCQLLSLTQQEDYGEKNAGISLLNIRIDKEGKTIEKLPRMKPAIGDVDLEVLAVKEAVENQEGCRLQGNFSITENPGHFLFDMSDKREVFHNLPKETKKKISLDFILHHLSFGMDPNHKMINMRYPKENFSPYNGLTIPGITDGDKVSMFIQIVTNHYQLKGPSSQKQIGLQFAARYQKTEVNMHELPSFAVAYSFSPIHVNHSRVYHSFSRFLVDTLAIVGGIFSVMGMLSNYTLSRFKELRNL